jgi:hypothetical protein
MSKYFSGPKIMNALQKLSKNLKGQSINELRLILAIRVKTFEDIESALSNEN